MTGETELPCQISGAQNNTIIIPHQIGLLVNDINSFFFFLKAWPFGLLLLAAMLRQTDRQTGRQPGGLSYCIKNLFPY